MRVTLMHNPKAGDAKHDKTQLMAALKKAGHRVIYQSTKKDNYKDAFKLPTDVVLAAGGDGTVGKIGRQLLGTGIPLSVLPLGTANNLARNLGFEGSIAKLIAQLKRGTKYSFDVGVARAPWGEKHFFEGVGGGLFADYLKRTVEKNKTSKNASKEQELTRHVRLLRQTLRGYPPRRWKIEIDGADISDDYILWEAMNIRSIGPGLYLAPPALHGDGHLDFVFAREQDRSLFIASLDAWLAARRKRKFPLPLSRFRKLKVECGNSLLHLDGKLWPRKKQKMKPGDVVEITLKPSALLVLRPPAEEEP
jgi:diacylglycerol kinase family enzyme